MRLPVCRLHLVFALATLVILSGAASPYAQETAATQGTKKDSALYFYTETRTTPRPLKLYFLRLDLQSKEHKLTTLVAPDPDGTGPADARLVDPRTLSKTTPGIIAAINTNAFKTLPGSRSIPGFMWYENRPVEICGWVQSGSKLIRPPVSGYASFWLTPKGTAQIGKIAQPSAAQVAVAGFGMLVDNNTLTPPTGGPLHPRTALGIDQTGRHLWWLVVDGRQPGISEGLALRELATEMKTLGCSHAINLDGGGSSILLLRDTNGTLAIRNQPSGKQPRPLPVMLAICKTTPPSNK